MDILHHSNQPVLCTRIAKIAAGPGKHYRNYVMQNLYDGGQWRLVLKHSVGGGARKQTESTDDLVQAP